MNQKMEYLRNGVRYCLLLILLVLAFATGAHAAQDDYYYPNYDASANGCVDLMNYVKRVTVTVNGECEIIWTTREKPDFMRVCAA